MKQRGFSHSASAERMVRADLREVFDEIDRAERMSAHMGRRSGMMAGGTMSMATDAGGGKAVGSRTRLSGKVLGMNLWADAEVVERTPPWRKSWQTIGEPRLLVIGPYRMSVRLDESGPATHARVVIDYSPPGKRPWRWLGTLLGPRYAKWCVTQMAADLERTFAPK